MAADAKYAAGDGAAAGDVENGGGAKPRTSAPSKEQERKQIKLRKPKLMREMSRNLSELEVTKMITSYYYRRWLASAIVFGVAFVCVFFLLSWPQYKVYTDYTKTTCYIVGNSTDMGGPNQCTNSGDPTTCHPTFKCVLNANYRTDGADPRPPACPLTFYGPPITQAGPCQSAYVFMSTSYQLIPCTDYFASHPYGSVTDCYYNPNDYTSVVFSKDLTLTMLVVSGLLALAVLISCIGLHYEWVQRCRLGHCRGPLKMESLRQQSAMELDDRPRNKSGGAASAAAAGHGRKASGGSGGGGAAGGGGGGAVVNDRPLIAPPSQHNRQQADHQRRVDEQRKLEEQFAREKAEADREAQHQREAAAKAAAVAAAAERAHADALALQQQQYHAAAPGARPTSWSVSQGPAPAHPHAAAAAAAAGGQAAAATPPPAFQPHGAPPIAPTPSVAPGAPASGAAMSQEQVLAALSAQQQTLLAQQSAQRDTLVAQHATQTQALQTTIAQQTAAVAQHVAAGALTAAQEQQYHAQFSAQTAQLAAQQHNQLNALTAEHTGQLTLLQQQQQHYFAQWQQQHALLLQHQQQHAAAAAGAAPQQPQVLGTPTDPAPYTPPPTFGASAQPSASAAAAAGGAAAGGLHGIAVQDGGAGAKSFAFGHDA